MVLYSFVSDKFDIAEGRRGERERERGGEGEKGREGERERGGEKERSGY